MTSHRTLAAISAFALLSLAACSSAAAPSGTATATATATPTATAVAVSSPTVAPPVATPTPAPKPEVPAAVQGTYHAQIDTGPSSTGLWKLMITAHNMYLTNPIGGADSVFPLDPTVFNADHISFAAGGDCPDPADYTYVVTGDTLTITMITDTCTDRASVLTSAPWQLQ